MGILTAESDPFLLCSSRWWAVGGLEHVSFTWSLARDHRLGTAGKGILDHPSIPLQVMAQMISDGLGKLQPSRSFDSSSTVGSGLSLVESSTVQFNNEGGNRNDPDPELLGIFPYRVMARLIMSGVRTIERDSSQEVSLWYRTKILFQPTAKRQTWKPSHRDSGGGTFFSLPF